MKNVVHLVVVAAEGDRTVEADVPSGERVLDLCDELGAPILFSCRTASCGVCRVHVLAGAKNFTQPSADELEVLEIFEASPNERLACQLVVGSGDDRIELCAVEPLPKDRDIP